MEPNAPMTRSERHLIQANRQIEKMKDASNDAWKMKYLRK